MFGGRGVGFGNSTTTGADVEVTAACVSAGVIATAASDKFWGELSPPGRLHAERMIAIERDSILSVFNFAFDLTYFAMVCTLIPIFHHTHKAPQPHPSAGELCTSPLGGEIPNADIMSFTERQHSSNDF
jgi:hypothetical protein